MLTASKPGCRSTCAEHRTLIGGTSAPSGGTIVPVVHERSHEGQQRSKRPCVRDSARSRASEAEGGGPGTATLAGITPICFPRHRRSRLRCPLHQMRGSAAGIDAVIPGFRIIGDAVAVPWTGKGYLSRGSHKTLPEESLRMTSPSV